MKRLHCIFKLQENVKAISMMEDELRKSSKLYMNRIRQFYQQLEAGVPIDEIIDRTPRFHPSHMVVGKDFMKQYPKTRRQFVKKGGFQTKRTSANVRRMIKLLKMEQSLLYLQTFNHTKQMESLIRHKRRICRRFRSWSWDEMEPFAIDAVQVIP